jgi:Mrp family chromosome partitioning ATPase
MSALDRSFIRAFHRPAAAEKAAPAEMATAAAPRPTGERPTASPAVPLSRALADLDHASAAPQGVAASSVSTSLGALLDEALQPALTQAAAPIEALAATVKTITTTLPKSIASALPGAANASSTSVQPAPPPAQNVTTGSAAGAGAWRPLLQVDRLVWPSIFHRLETSAQPAVEQMADGLQTIADTGRRVIGLASCATGEGVTTLLSVAARKLLSRGKKVVLVDGHWANPQLAKCLGLLPQVGWEDALTGGLPLEEVVIESIADGLAVLPVCASPQAMIATVAIVAGLEILAREFDFVLVDLGSLENGTDDKQARHVTAATDAVVLVHNVRATPPNRVAEARQRLAASNVRYAGTIQNFVAG